MEVVAFIALAVIGYISGSLIEQRHYANIKRRERRLLNLPAITFGEKDQPEVAVADARLVIGHVVIATDYFKRFLAALRNFFGGSISSYESLVDRARREAVLRMKEAAPDAAMIINTRIETANIGSSMKKRGTVACVEAIAYGTALYE